MGESAGKPQKRYVDILKIESKTCRIHGLGHSYDKCKVLGDFGTKYDKSIKNLTGYMPTVMFTEGIGEDNPPHLRINPRWERALASPKNDM